MGSFTVDPTSLASLEHTISGLYLELSQMHKIARFEKIAGGCRIELAS